MTTKQKRERAILVTFRMKPSTKQAFADAAQREGMKLSAWIRRQGYRRLAELEGGRGGDA